MKKVVIAAFALVTLSAVTATAQTTAPASPKTPAATAPASPTAPATQTTPPAQTEPATPTPAVDKTAVLIEELPAAVKATLASPSLKAWTPIEAFLVKGADGKEYYAINIKKENESGSVQLDKDGKPVK
jgi:hypothetical protein